MAVVPRRANARQPPPPHAELWMWLYPGCPHAPPDGVTDAQSVAADAVPLEPRLQP